MLVSSSKRKYHWFSSYLTSGSLDTARGSPYMFADNVPGVNTQCEGALLVLGSVLMASVVLVLGNLCADVLLAIADPRIVHD